MDYVIDASVAVKWFVEEDYSQVARYLLKNFEKGSNYLYAPSLLIHEVGNSLWRMVNRLKLLKSQYAINAYRMFLEIPIHYVDLTEEDASNSLKLSLELGSTFYDSVYVSLSKKLGKTLVTADEDILEKAGGQVKVIDLKELV